LVARSGEPLRDHKGVLLAAVVRRGRPEPVAKEPDRGDVRTPGAVAFAIPKQCGARLVDLTPRISQLRIEALDVCSEAQAGKQWRDATQHRGRLGMSRDTARSSVQGYSSQFRLDERKPRSRSPRATGLALQERQRRGIEGVTGSVELVRVMLGSAPSTRRPSLSRKKVITESRRSRLRICRRT
jgi:hypothetical protein